MRDATPPVVKPLIFPSYLALIENSIGTHMFRTFIADIDGQTSDVLNNGLLSCAFYASSILTLFKLIERPHTTVTQTIIDLEESGWVKIEKPRIGCVLIWAEHSFDENVKHTHIGFYIDTDLAISNSSEDRVPKKHHWTFDTHDDGKPVREITAMYWSDKLV